VVGGVAGTLKDGGEKDSSNDREKNKTKTTHYYGPKKQTFNKTGSKDPSKKHTKGTTEPRIQGDRHIGRRGG